MSEPIVIYSTDGKEMVIYSPSAALAMTQSEKWSYSKPEKRIVKRKRSKPKAS